jgi:hypothetical protein
LYTVVTDEQAQPHVDSLPVEALAAFAEVRVLLETAPWAGRPYHLNNPHGPLRVQPFATYGQVLYLILEDQRRVDILMVQWVG